MTTWKPMNLADIHKGTIGYVAFDHSSQKAMILCEVLDIKGERIEIVPVTGDLCLWIKSDEIYTRLN